MQVVQFLLNLAGPYIGQIITGAAGILGIGFALFMATQSGKKSQKLQDENNTLKETINASKARTEVDATVANTTDAERDRMLHTWDRDKQ